MKRLVILLLLPSLLLSGCGSIYSNYREVEQLLVIETMGFDYIPGGVQLTLAAGMSSGSAKGPIRLVGTGKSLSTAMDQARNYSFEDELFCSQTNGILIGEEAAVRGIEGYLSYICQSPMLRTDVPVFIIKGASANESIMGTGDSQHGVSEILQGVTEYLETRGGSHIFKASELVRSSLRHGSALCCVLEYSQSKEPPVDTPQKELSSQGDTQTGSRGSQEQSQGGSGSQEQSQSSGGQGQSQSGGGSQSSSQSGSSSQEENASQSSSGGGQEGDSSQSADAKTLAVAGFGVLRDNKLIHYIDKEQAVGVSFLINEVGISNIELEDAEGRGVVLEISQGSSHVTPRWNEKAELTGLDFNVDVHATVTEMNDDADLTDKRYTQELTTALEEYLGGQLGDILRLSSRLEADFLSLGAQVEQAAPLLYRHMDKSFAQTLPQLEFRIAVRGQLSHTNDMKESLT